MAVEQHGIDSVVRSLARSSTHLTFEGLPAQVAEEAEHAGLYGVRLFLADRQQHVLKEVTGKGPDAARDGEQLQMDGSSAGLSFIHTQVLQVGRRPQYWVPVLNGSERLGVLHIERAVNADHDAMHSLASITGLLVVDKRTISDSYARLIRNRTMSVSAEMQWNLMPPTAFTNERITLAAATEPAYENAGDSFDYALSGDIVHMALFDAMGHDNAAGLLANLTVGAFRNARRNGTGLADMPAEVEAILTEGFLHSRFTTGIMAELDTTTGVFRWVNCGHLPPVLLHGQDAVRTLECYPTHPLGMDFEMPVHVCSEQLQPGDRIIMYTDGMVEARDSQGEEFGVEQFVRFIVRQEADQLPVPETLRRLIHAVMAHHHGELRDDATVSYCEWHGN